MPNLSLVGFYLLGVIGLSLISFALYGWDKRQAQANGSRIPEQTLHLLALLGGWPGALLGQRSFRHKTKKTNFRIKFWLSVIGHCLILAGAAYLLRDRN